MNTGSDIGSLYPLVQAQALRGPASLSFLKPGVRSVDAWKKRGRAKLRELLAYDPPKVPPRAEVIERIDAGDHWRERITFATTPDIRVPAFVLVPKNAALPAPGIVALHDHGGFYLWGKEKLIALPGEHPSLTAFRQRSYEGVDTAVALVRRGYVVIVTDMFYWGERRLLLDDDPADWRERTNLTAERVDAYNRRSGDSEPLVGRSIYTAGFTWPGVMLTDDIRTVDYLASRPDVDPKRLGCVGLSVGGFRSIHLAAQDDRIKAAVAVGWMTSFAHQIQRHVRWTVGHSMLVPGLYRHLDYPDVAALAMPTALMVVHGSRDTLFAPEGVRAAFDTLSACWRKAGVPEKLALRVHDTPHEFNKTMQADAWAWLEKWL